MSELVRLDGDAISDTMQHMLRYPGIQNLLGEDMAGALSAEVRDLVFPIEIPDENRQQSFLYIPEAKQASSSAAVVCIKPVRTMGQLLLTDSLRYPTPRRRSLMTQELIGRGTPAEAVPQVLAAGLQQDYARQPEGEGYQIDFKKGDAPSTVTFMQGWHSGATYISRPCIQLNPNTLPTNYRLATLVLRQTLVAHDIDSNPWPLSEEAETLADFRATVLEAELLRQGIARGLIAKTDREVMAIDTLRRAHKMNNQDIFVPDDHFATPNMIGIIKLGTLQVFDLRRAMQHAVRTPRRR